MSFRTSLTRAARPALARAAYPAPVIGRRAASSSHGPSSNTPWAVGSAAVFGSLAAFILMPKGQDAAAHVHDSVEAKGEGAHVAEAGEKPEHQKEEHDNARDLMRKERAAGDRAQHEEDPKGKMVHATEARSRTEIPSKRDDEKSMRRGPSTGADVQESETGTVDPQHMQAGVANKGYNTSGGTSKGDNKSDEYDNDTGKDGASSGEGVKESVEQAVAQHGDSAGVIQKSNAPKVAAAAEQAKDTVADKASQVADKAKSATQSSGGDSGDADEPSQKDIVDSIHQAENVAVPRAAMADEGK